jgi:hypothetical protein
MATTSSTSTSCTPAGEHVDDPRIPEPDGMHFGAG